jgi:hypothetical protein
VHHWYVAAVVLGVVFAAGLVMYLWWRHQQQGENGGSGELAMQLANNPLHPYEQKLSPRTSLSGRLAKRRGNAYLAVRMLYQPVRILVGYIQVRSTCAVRRPVSVANRILKPSCWYGRS